MRIKEKWKYYSPEAKVRYHTSREKNASLSEGKRLYSYYWLRGFFDSHAKTNVKSAIAERDRCKKAGYLKTASDRAIYDGDIAGMRARLKTTPYIANQLEEKYKK